MKCRFGCRLLQFVEDGLRHRRRVLLRRQAVAPADDARQRHVVRPAFGKRRDDVLVERLADGARLLRAVEHGDRLHRLRQRGDEGLHVERPVQPHRDEADLLARGDQPGHRFARGADARAHLHDHALGIRRAVVPEQAVAAAGQLREALHRLADDARHRGVERVAGLARLEEHVRVLRRAADDRRVRVQRARAMRHDQFVVDQLARVVFDQQVDLVDLVAGAEAVEEVQERHPRLQRRHVGDHRHVLRFLHARRRQQREAGGAGAHHVAVVAEDRQRVRGQRAGGDVEHRRRQLAGDLEHVGQLQQQALRRRERRRQRAGLQRAVHRAGGAAPRSASRSPRAPGPRCSSSRRPTRRRPARPCSTTA